MEDFNSDGGKSVEAGNPKKRLAAWLDDITEENAAIMNDGRTSKEMMDELYDDETGLPK